MAKRGRPKGKKNKKAPAKNKNKLSPKLKGKLWGGLKGSWRSFKASVATLKNRSASKNAKAKARKRLEGAKKAIGKFQEKLGLRARPWKGVAA